MRRSGLFVLLLWLTHYATAQNGSWQPAGAAAAYPRTLLTAAALPAVRQALSEPTRYALYEGLYGSVAGAPSADTTSTSGRRARATFAKNLAFVLLLDRRPTGSGTVGPLAAPEQAALQATGANLLATINFKVEAVTSYTEWQWRSKELIDYLVAYDLLRGAGVPAADLATGRAKLQKFAGNLQTQSTTPFFGMSFYNLIKNNHALMTAAALGMAGVVLNDATGATTNQQPATWVSTGMWVIDNVLWQDAQRQSDPAATVGYAEGPYYFKYAFLNCLPFFRAMGHFLPAGPLPYTFGGSTRHIPNPYYDPRYNRLYNWLTTMLLPDGRFPALEDSYVDMGMPELALTGQPRYVRPMCFSKLEPGQLRSLTAQLRDITVDMRAAYLAANLDPGLPDSEPLTALPGSGNLVFRSGPDSLATYLHLYGKNGLPHTNSGGHSQADASSFVLHAYGQLLALDAGYLSYDRRTEVGQATNHNLLLVDGAGPAIGTSGNPNDAAATIQNTFQTSQLSYGEVQTSYQSTTITRRLLFVRNTYFLLADFVAAAAAHVYTWQLHGYGLQDGTAATGTFGQPSAHEGQWQKNGVSLQAHVTATGGADSYTTATRPHELTYNTTQDHTTLLVDKSRVAQTQFLAALYPSVGQPGLVATTTSTATTAALVVQNTFRDVAFAQADTLFSQDQSNTLPQPVGADGRLVFYSADSAGLFAQLFLHQGTVLRYGTDTVAHATCRTDLSWQRNGATSYSGYVSRATTLRLRCDTAVQAVTGAGVSSFRYDAAARQLHITFSQASSFDVTAGRQPLPVGLTEFRAARRGEAVTLRWHTAAEQQNQGFAVQRATAPTTGFRTIGFVAGAGTSATPHEYTFLDAPPLLPLAYYRLEQRNHDGTVTYSPVVAVAAASGPALSATPNPASHLLTVAAAGSEPLHLVLLDVRGCPVRRAAGPPPVQLNVAGLAAGLYLLQTTDAEGRLLGISQRIVVQP